MREVLMMDEQQSLRPGVSAAASNGHNAAPSPALPSPEWHFDAALCDSDGDTTAAPAVATTAQASTPLAPTPAAPTPAAFTAATPTTAAPNPAAPTRPAASTRQDASTRPSAPIRPTARTPAAPNQRRHGCADTTPSTAAPADTPSRDQRGGYVRDVSTGKGIRQKWDVHALEHMKSIDSGELGAATDRCSGNCQFHGQCLQSNFTVLLLRKCAAATFGDDVLRGKIPDIRNHTARRNWFKLLYNCRVLNANGSVREIAHHVRGARICAGAFEAVYSIPPATMTELSNAVLRGHHEWVTFARTSTSNAASEKITLTSISEAWWTNRLRCYDFMPHIQRVIIHPVRILLC